MEPRMAVERSSHGGAPGLLPFERTVRASAPVRVPFRDVERAVRLCLAALLQPSASGAQPTDGRLVVDVHVRGRFGRMRVPVVVDVETPRHPEAGAVAHLRWRARRLPKLFPIMDADLSAHPRLDDGSELALSGSYRPPLGPLGVLGDLVVGRLAHSTTQALVEDLAAAIESGRGGCGAVSAGVEGVARGLPLS
ncbi:MAG TPA: hypothetical protein VKV36_05630 [Acidimicrobiales bacterium]|nr:hypothetical protein [Acidimicrobiales bacterium]